ncbi:TRAP transporter, DctQ-like membrane protein [Synechococcus sp. PCC 7335]|uniref:TRAP transporter small permease subunit n=1 Tax=Synechococcus sp. (strain ATCC 29403 / PCC 7335) TaxID=91464 RepID=UPI00017ECAF7|nr:TRAP transporter small permease subunit [Synechococcus sp. PCC 7335]EDX85618.1 TRAP transporter, DctQ-like membrane protein [Synechococcus sp. PCC 7335]
MSLLQVAHRIDRFINAIGRLTYWLVLVMIGVGVWNVLGRYVGNAIGQNLSSNGLIETQWYLFDLVFLLGAAYTLQHNEHVRVDVFYARFNRKQKAIADLIGTLFFLIPFSILVLYFSWGAVSKSWAVRETSPDPGGLLRYPIKTMILVCFVLLILQGISEAIKNWAIIQNPSIEPILKQRLEEQTTEEQPSSGENR